MRKITMQTCSAFKCSDTLKIGNTYTNGKALYLHGNKIAEKRNDRIWITNAGWDTNTTNSRLNGLHGVRVYHEKGKLMFNGIEWNGDWIRVDTGEQESEDSLLNSIAMVAKMGEILCDNQKEKNDWKTRMLKAGLENKRSEE